MMPAFGVALATLLDGASALAQSGPLVRGTANEAPISPPERKLGVGGDFLLILPFGAYADRSGPSAGPVLRGGYRISPSWEMTLRTGFLLGLGEGTGSRADGTHLETALSIVPVWTGTRYFFSGTTDGPYGVGELGLNILVPSGGEMGARLGVNAGVGYVLSRALPIDIRVQGSVLNLFEDIPRDAGSERTSG